MKTKLSTYILILFFSVSCVLKMQGAVLVLETDSLNNISVGLTNTNIRDTIRINTSITDIFTDGDGNIVIVDENGNQRILDEDFNRTLIVGENGEEFVVTNNGRVMGVDEFRETGGNRFKQEEANREREANAQPSVFFTKYERQRFGFDAYSDEKIGIQHKYPIMVHNYRPAFKSVESFQTDRVNTDAGQHVTFRTEWGIPAQRNNEQVTIRGDVAGSVTALYAFKQLNDTTEVVAGKLNIMSFDRQTKRVFLVPVNGVEIRNLNEIKKTLNRIYEPTITDWNVELLPSIDVDFPDGNMVHGGTSLLTVYNRDQRLIINTFGNMERDAFYLFFVDNVQDRTLASLGGYMPLQRQVGFIYNNSSPEVIAHELGHGAFNLWHTFSDRDFVAPQGTTRNLMDYTLNGTELWHHQWELIQNPERILFAFLQDEEEGEARNDDIFRLKINQHLINIGERLGEREYIIVYSTACSTNVAPAESSSLFKDKPISIEFNNRSYQGTASRFDVDGRITITLRINLDETYGFFGGTSIVGDNTVVVDTKEDGTFLGVITRNRVYTCESPKDLTCEFAQKDTDRFFAKMFSAVLECLENYSEEEEKLGDKFRIWVLARHSQVDISTINKIADSYNRIADILFEGQATGNEWEKYKEYFIASFEAALTAGNINNGDYLERLNEFIRIFESRLRELSLASTDKVAILVGTFTDVELLYLPMDLRIRTLNTLTRVRAIPRLLFDVRHLSTNINNWAMQENMILKLLRQVQNNEQANLLERLRTSGVIKAINDDLDDFITLVDDNYSEFLDIIDEYVFSTNNIQANNVNRWIEELYQKDRFFNISQTDEQGKSFISSSRITNTGEVVLRLQEFTGEYDFDPFLGNVPRYTQRPPTNLPYDAPIVIYHNRYALGLPSDKMGEMEVVSALRAHYYMRRHSDARVKAAIWTTVDVATFFIPGGQAVGAMRGLYKTINVANKISSVSSVLATTSEERLINDFGEAGQVLVSTLRIISAAAGIVDLGATATARFIRNSTDEMVRIGVFYRQNQNLVNSNPNFRPIRELYNSFDADILRAIDNAYDVVRQGRIMPTTADEIRHLLTPDRNTAFFWSGNTNGIGGEIRALEIAQSKGGTTLEGLLRSRNIDMPIWESNPQIWRDVSRIYAQQASGEVRAVVGRTVNPDGVWLTIELPALRANPNVTKITTIDPATLEEVIIFIR